MCIFRLLLECLGVDLQKSVEYFLDADVVESLIFKVAQRSQTFVPIKFILSLFCKGLNLNRQQYLAHI